MCRINSRGKITFIDVICLYFKPKYNLLAQTYDRWSKGRVSRRVWRYQREAIRIRISKKNRQHNGQKETGQKDKQRSTRHTYKTKDRITRTPRKTRSELRCSGRVSISCSTSDTRRVILVTNPVISHERRKDREVFTTSGTYPWIFLTQISYNGQPSLDYPFKYL